MSAREDLLKVAESLAGRASAAALSGQPITYESIRTAQLAAGAKAALEAAALVDVDPAPITAAAVRLNDRLQKLGTSCGLEYADELPAADAIDVVTELVEHLLNEITIGSEVQHGYARLRELIEGLERDFAAADSPVARRTAARLHAGLEEAEQAIKAASVPPGQEG